MTMLFDTYDYVKKLKAVGFTEQQAEVHASALSNLVDRELVTKEYFKEYLTARLSETKSEILKWVMGFFIAQTGILIASFLTIARLLK